MISPRDQSGRDYRAWWSKENAKIRADLERQMDESPVHTAILRSWPHRSVIGRRIARMMGVPPFPTTSRDSRLYTPPEPWKP